MGRQIKSVRSHRAAKNLTHNSRKHAFTHTPIALALAGVLLCGAAQAQQSITYTGDPSMLQTINGVANSLDTALDTSGNSVSVGGNTVTIKAANTIGGDVYGAFQSTDAQANTSGNTVNFIAGRVTLDIYGGYANVANTTADSPATSTASRNTISTSPGSFVDDEIYGGYANASTSGDNSSATATASDNRVAIGGWIGEAPNGIYGGYANVSTSGKNSAATATASNNAITVSGRADDNDVYGGYAYISTNDENSAATATVSNNTIAVSGYVDDEVRGGHAEVSTYGADNSPATATASNNTITVSGWVDEEVYGSYLEIETSGANSAATAIASNNTITVSGTVDDDVYGSYLDIETSGANSAATAIANNNTIMVSGIANNYVYGGEVYASTYGADNSPATATASNNAITISGTVEDDVKGGEADADTTGDNSAATATASNNTIVISGRVEDDSVYGGEADASTDGNSNSAAIATASGNTITVSNSGYVDEDIWGGSVTANTYGADNSPATATASNNTITVSGIANDYVYGGDADADTDGTNSAAIATANNNTVTVSGYVDDYVFGGETRAVTGGANSAATATASGNTITIGGNVGDVHGGAAEAYANGSDNSPATATTSNNAITISGMVRGVVLGGTAYAATDGANSPATATASGNIITVSDTAMVGGDVFGGNAMAVVNGTDSLATATASGNTIMVSGAVGGDVVGGEVDVSGTDSIVNATGNTIVISGTPTFGAGTNIAGGRLVYGTGDVRTGNTLHMRTTGVTASNIANFQHLRFALPNSSIASGTAALTLTDVGGTDISTPLGESATTVGVSIAGGSNTLQAGQRVNLIHNAGVLTTDVDELPSTITGSQGLGLLYTMTLAGDGNTLSATVSQVNANPRAKSLSEGRIGAAAFVNQGADMVAGMGMERALAAAQSGVNGFGGMSGGKTRHKSGSHVDVKGVNLLLGAATNLPNSAGNLMLGGFFEAGWGNYDSFNSFTNGNVKASGDNRYYGAGVLARQDFASKLYVEGSARAGKLDNDYASSDLKDGFGNTASYKLNKAYYGLHLGVGYQMPVGTGEVDLSAKYLFTQQKGGNALIAGDTYTFKSINSQRTRLGAMYKHPLNANATLKLGAAWEHEFDGKAKASVHGVNLATPEIKGSSAVLEAGISYKPQSNSKLSIEAGVQGYAGKRQGATGNVAVKYLF